MSTARDQRTKLYPEFEPDMELQAKKLVPADGGK